MVVDVLVQSNHAVGNCCRHYRLPGESLGHVLKVINKILLLMALAVVGDCRPVAAQPGPAGNGMG
jgi:hypothetical protein